MGSHAWLVKTYLWALAIIFAYVLFLTSVFDRVGMVWGLWMCVANTFLGILTEYSVLSTPGLAIVLLSLAAGWGDEHWGLPVTAAQNQLIPHISGRSLQDSSIDTTHILRGEAEIIGQSASSVTVPLSQLSVICWHAKLGRALTS